MNVLDMDYDDNEPEFKVHQRGKRQTPSHSQSSRRPTYGRSRSKKPTQVNGMHRRRSRRIMW